MKRYLWTSAMLLAGVWSAVALSGGSPLSGDTDSTGRGTPPPGGRNPAVDEALRACQASLGGSGNTRVDPQEMDACMTAKGFKRPPGPPPDGGGRPPGNPPPAASSAGP